MVSIKRKFQVSFLACFASLFWSGCKIDSIADDGDKVIIPIENFRTLDTEPAWSPDGKSIAFVHVPRDSAERHQGPTGIWILDLETMRTTFLTVGSQPDWSHDGKNIVFERGAEIIVVDIKTKQETQLTTMGSCYYPNWSSDGKKNHF